MNLSGKHFEYDGISSMYYNELFIGYIDTEPLKKMSAEMQHNTAFIKSKHRHFTTGVDWSSSPFTFDLEFISEMPIDKVTNRKITKWLFNQNTFKKLYVAYPEDEDIERINGEVKRLYLSCIFINPEKIEYATGIHGYKCTCMLETPMAIQDDITITSTDSSIILNIDTDINDYIYPKMIITVANTAATSTVSNYYMGDVNRDGYIDASDSLLVLQASKNKCTLDAEQQALANVDGSGGVTEKDSQLILKYTVAQLGGTYPNIGTVKPTYIPSTTTINIVNSTDYSNMFVIGVRAGDIITADGAIGTITAKTDGFVLPVDYYDKLADQRFIRLLPGTNVLNRSDEITSVTFTWHNERWIV